MNSSKQINRYILRGSGILLTVLLLILAVNFAVSFFHTKEHVVTLDPNNVTSSPEDLSFSMGGLALFEGNYILSMDYKLTGAEAKAYLNIEQENEDMMLAILPNEAGGTPAQFVFMLDHPITNGRLTVNCDEGGAFTLLSLTLYSDRYMFSDGLVYAVFCLLAAAVLWILIRKIEKDGDIITPVSIMVMFLITTLPFICAKAQPVGGDLRGHMMRVDGTFLGILDGQFPVVINPQWDNRHGQLGILYPSLFLYPIALLRMMRMSIYGATKIMMLLVNAISCVFFYKASTVFYDRRWMRLLTTFLITFEYSRLYAITYGGKLGGSLHAMIFMPLVVAGLVDVLYKEGRKWYYLAIGLAGVFCCHIISSLMCCLVIVLITLIGIRQLKNKQVWIGAIKAVALFMVLILGSYVSFVRYYLLDWSAGKLTWRDFVGTLWRFSDFFFDNRWTYAFIITFVCAILFIIFAARSARTKEKITSIGMVFPVLITSVLLFWMATAYFPWVILRRVGMISMITDNLQSSNRLIGIAGTLASFCLPQLMVAAFERTGQKAERVIQTVIASVFVLYCLGGTYYATHEYLHTYIKIYDETVSYIDKDVDDYLPTGTIPEYYQSDAGFVSDEGIVNTLEYRKRGTNILYRYTAQSDGEYVEFPLFYYDGYVAFDESRNPIPVIKSERNKVQIDLPACTDAKEIHIGYNIPKVFTVTFALSMIAWVVAIIFAIRQECKTQPEQETVSYE